MKKNTEQLLDLIIELQALAQTGLYYTQDVFDQERYTRLRCIAAEMMSLLSETSIEQVTELFCQDVGYQTPKLDTRAVIFDQERRILLVQERDGRWSLPGGWVDINTSIAENTVKEVKEEAGLDVVCERLLFLHDRDKHNLPKYPYKVIKVFVECNCIEGAFQPNSETIASRYFALEELPELAGEKNNEEQLRLCFEAVQNPDWKVIFD